MPLHKGQAVRLNRPYGVLPTGTRLKLLGAKRRIVPVRLTDDRFPKLPAGFQRRFSVPIWFLSERRSNPEALVPVPDSTPPLLFPSCSLAVRRLARRANPRKNPGPLCPANEPCPPRQPPLPRQRNLGEPELGPEGRVVPPPHLAGRQIRRVDYACMGIRTGAGLCSLRENRNGSYKHHFGKGRRPLLLGNGEIRGRVRVETSAWVAGITDAERMAYPARRHNAAMVPVGYLEALYLVDGTVRTYPPGTVLMTDSQRDCLYIRQGAN